MSPADWVYQQVDPANVVNSEFYIQNLEAISLDFIPPSGSFHGSDGTIISAGQTRFERILPLGSEGTSLSRSELAMPIIGLFPFHPNLGLAFSLSGLYTLDTNALLNSIQQFPFTIDSVSSAANQTEYLLFSGDTVRLYDTSGVMIDQIITSPLMDTVYQISRKNNDFYVLGKDNDQLVLNIYGSGNLISTFIPDTVKADFRQFVPDPFSGKLMLIGYETAVENAHLLVQMYDLQNTTFEKSNFNLRLNETNLINSYVSQCSLVDSTGRNIMNFKIENLSASAVDSFYINASWNVDDLAIFCTNMDFCNDGQFAIKIISNLGPGDIYTSPDIYLQTGNSSIVPACFWVSSPNDQPDRDPSDDKICININVSTADLIKKDLAVKAFPNPASEIIQFHLPEAWKNKMYDLRITDITGRTIKSKKISETNPSDRVGELPDGIYLAIFRSVDGEEIATSFVVSK